MKSTAATILIALSMSLGGSGTAVAQTAAAHPTAKRCLTRACRENRSRHAAARAVAAPGPRA